MRAVFALLALVLAAVLGWQWRDWPPPATQPRAEDAASAKVKTPQPPRENPLDLLTPLGEKEEYAVVTERPLFLPGRRPPSEEPEEEVAPEPEKAADLARLDLNAVLITPAGSSAWVRDPANKDLVRLRPGDDLEGWSVQEILSDRVLLERQGETDTLILRDYKNMPPPKPPRGRPAARKPPKKPPREVAKRPPSAPAAKQPNPRRPDAGQPSVPRQPGARDRRTQMNATQFQQQREVQE